MKIHLLLRPFDRYTVSCYLGAVALMLFLSIGQDAPPSLFQGFAAAGGMGGVDLLGTMLWNLCVLPPVSACILYMLHEFETLFPYTILRSRTLYRWWMLRFAVILFLNYAFYFFAQLALTITRGNPLLLSEAAELAALFPLHTTLLSTLCCVGIVRFSSRGAIVSYLLVEGVLVIIGMAYPPISHFLLPYWGMTRSVGEQWILAVLGSLLLLAALNVAMIWLVRRHTLGAGTHDKEVRNGRHD